MQIKNWKGRPAGGIPLEMEKRASWEIELTEVWGVGRGWRTPADSGVAVLLLVSWTGLKGRRVVNLERTAPFYLMASASDLGNEHRFVYLSFQRIPRWPCRKCNQQTRMQDGNIFKGISRGSL